MSVLQRVLYVEDDPDIREIAELALKEVGGLDVALCVSGEQALAKAPDFAPQLVLLDVMMPDMDGPETLEALRAQGSVAGDTPVVFVTAKVHPDEVERYKQMGVADIIPKPFDPMSLADDLRSIWSRFHE